MQIGLTSGEIMVLLVPQLTLFLSFVIYARVEISVMKSRLATIEKSVEEDKRERIKESDEMKVAFRELNKKLDQQNGIFSEHLFQINTKVTEVSTFMSIKK